MTTYDRWLQAHKAETTYWLSLLKDPERIKNEDAYNRYKHVLGLDVEDVTGRIIIDLGGGPISILCHFDCPDSVVVDPLDIPTAFITRYHSYNISYWKIQAEKLLSDFQSPKFDEVWMYNCLTHTQNPEFILKNVHKLAPILRIGEPMGTNIDVAHPHTFTVDQMKQWLLEISSNHHFLFTQYDYLYFGGVFELK